MRSGGVRMPIRASETDGKAGWTGRARSALTACAILLAGSAAAQDGMSETELTFFNGDTYREILWVALQRAENILRDPSCNETMTGADRQHIVVIEPLVTQPNTRFPSSGIWRDQLAVTRCGVRHVHNLRFDAREQAAPKPMVLVPGQSMASAQLQVDTMAPLVALVDGANDANKNCDDTQVRDTSAPEGLNGGEPDFAEGWVETWTIRSCGELHRVPVTFRSNDDGSTTILPGDPQN